jgi:hypothetical protein
LRSFSVGATNDRDFFKYAVAIVSGGMIYVYTKSHDDRFRHSSNIKDIASTISEVTALVLLRGIYDVRH